VDTGKLFIDSMAEIVHNSIESKTIRIAWALCIISRSIERTIMEAY